MRCAGISTSIRASAHARAGTGTRPELPNAGPKSESVHPKTFASLVARRLGMVREELRRKKRIAAVVVIRKGGLRGR
jgi:hypothetical protein